MVHNKNGGPRKHGRNGLFDTEDEDALKELATIIASVISRVDAVTEQSCTLSMLPTLATAATLPECVSMLTSQIQIALNADKAAVFLITPGGNFAHHERGVLSDVSFPPTSYPFTLVLGAGRAAHRVKLKNLKEVHTPHSKPYSMALISRTSDERLGPQPSTSPTA